MRNIKELLNDKTILVWQFYEAHKHFQELSGHGGDEDWIAFVPESMKNDYIGWAEGGAFGCCDVSTHEVDGGKILIGAHA